jgi:hypothetical protein
MAEVEMDIGNDREPGRSEVTIDGNRLKSVFGDISTEAAPLRPGHPGFPDVVNQPPPAVNSSASS